MSEQWEGSLLTLMAQTFGEWIKDTREERGWTIQRCANTAGMRWQSWARLEHDEPRSQSGNPPQRRRETVSAVARGLVVEEAVAFAAAGLRNVTTQSACKTDEVDRLLLEAVGELDLEDRKALHNLVTHLKTRKHITEESSTSKGMQTEEEPISSALTDEGCRKGPRTLGIDLDMGYLRDTTGKIIGDTQFPLIAELLGQLAAIYTRSKYALGDADEVLSGLRRELNLPDPAAERDIERVTKRF